MKRKKSVTRGAVSVATTSDMLRRPNAKEDTKLLKQTNYLILLFLLLFCWSLVASQANLCSRACFNG